MFLKQTNTKLYSFFSIILLFFLLLFTISSSSFFLENVIAPPMISLLLLPKQKGISSLSNNDSSSLSNSLMMTAWSSAIRLRNGDVIFIASDSIESAIVNNNVYVFKGQNLYYFDNHKKISLFLTYLIPGHNPLGVTWQYVHAQNEIQLDGESVLIYTATCILRLWIKAFDFWYNPQISIVAGQCYETTSARDGMFTFARFIQIQYVSASCKKQMDCAILLLSDNIEEGGSKNSSGSSRLSLLHKGSVRSIHLPSSASAISLWGTSIVAIAWSSGGFSLSTFDTIIMKKRIGDIWGANEKWLALSILDSTHVFAFSDQGNLVRFASNSTISFLGITPFKPILGHTHLALDFPYGLYVLDIARKVFYLAPNLGCLCPPGFASLAEIQKQHCQPAPAGGFVDVLGHFVPCPIGTYGTLSLATTQQTCALCPPSTISNQNQSTHCTPCSKGLISTPKRTECLQSCPLGTFYSSSPFTTSDCLVCPIQGQTFDLDTFSCITCPEGTYTDPENEIYTCIPCPGPSPPCPIHCPSASLSLNSSSSSQLVATIAILGIHPIDMTVAKKNGTVYIAAFQSMISIGQSGNVLEVNLPQLAMVKGIALNQDESILYAVITQASLLCLTFVDSPQLLHSWYLASPIKLNSLLVGIRLWNSQPKPMLILWDATTNNLYCSFTTTISTSSFFLCISQQQGIQTTNQEIIISFTTSSSTIFIMYRNQNNKNIQTIRTHKGHLIAQNSNPSTNWNPYMAIWQNHYLMLSSYHACILLYLQKNTSKILTTTIWGIQNVSGRVDSDNPMNVRFSNPGPMVEAPNSNMLLMVDQISLRVLFKSIVIDDDHHTEGFECPDCPEGYYSKSNHCIPCPTGWFSMLGSKTCTTCTQGQFTNPKDGKCTPCPKIQWWNDTLLPCSHIVDSMVGSDTSGLTLNDIISELLFSKSNTLIIMQEKDYVSLQTLISPLPMDTVLWDSAANARFWIRSQRITPLPEVYIFNELLDIDLELDLPGFWVTCSKYVLETEPCTCHLPAGGLLLGNNDMNTLWNKARAKAASIDHSTLLITRPSDSMLFLSTNSTLFKTNFNISSINSLFVSRINTGGGGSTDDDQSKIIFIESILDKLSITIQPTLTSTPSQNAFATCVVGWPATYSCPPGFLWVPPLFTCVPCKPGFYFLNSICIPCPKGSFNNVSASTTCILCPTSYLEGQSHCNVSKINNNNQQNNTIIDLNCKVGFEFNESSISCSPCLPGYNKPVNGSKSSYCTPCAPGQYTNTSGKSTCDICPFPLISTQWGSSICTSCTLGTIPSRKADECHSCIPFNQYFKLINFIPRCINKTTFQCSSGFYLNDGGILEENQCLPCLPCPEGTVMVPFMLSPCDKPTSKFGSPFRCIPFRSVPGQFSRLSVNMLDSSAFDIQYTPCQGLPLYARWTEGPSASYCFFECNYAIMGPSKRQYLFYYSIEKQDAQNQYMLQNLLPNVFPLDFPGLAVDLMLLANKVCMPCPNTPCPLGKWRPIVDGCGPPVCNSNTCQIMEAGPINYEVDGCDSNCSKPSNSNFIGLAPVGQGDACPWQCNFGFFIERMPMMNSFMCLPCSPTLCKPGIEQYAIAKCLPTSKRTDFCLPCPSSDLAILTSVVRSPADIGTCQYTCQPNVSFQSSLDQQCKPCPIVTCPAGQRLICAEQPCIPCPPLPVNLWSSAIFMPTSTSQCQSACRDGFHTLDIITRTVYLPPAFSYDPNTILCTPCSQRPNLPCFARACPTGFFMRIPGSGICTRCPNDFDCPLGEFPSSCICTQCPTPSLNQISISASEADMLLKLYGNQYPVSIRCSTVCTWNTMIQIGSMNTSSSISCVDCSTFNKDGLTFYSVWNASNGTRWWPSTQDPPHLPPRSVFSTSSERRAGLCWPCPSGFITLPGDSDLCLSPDAVSVISTQLLSVNTKSEGGIVFESSIMQPIHFLTRRKLLEIPSSAFYYKKKTKTKQIKSKTQPSYIFFFIYIYLSSICIW
jgi:hypothetical protein